MSVKMRTALTALFSITPVVVVAAMTLALRDDPREPVAAIDLGHTNVSLPAASGTAPSDAQQVAALDLLEGTLEQRGDDIEDFSLGVVELQFGPEEWLITAGALEDYDGDGRAEELLDELQNLVGTTVRVLVRLDMDGNEAEVYVLNELTYRDSAGGPAPWQQTSAGTGAVASEAELVDAALRAVGPGARFAEIEPAIAGEVAWEVDVIDSAGIEQNVLLSAAGDVLDVRPDD